MLKRKMYTRLSAWRNHPDRQPLLIQGARHTGKTYLVEQFAKEHYQSFINLNLERERSYRVIFDGDLDPLTIMQKVLMTVPGSRMIPGSTVLFLDEIQNCPRARAAIKFLAENRDLDVIAAASMPQVRIQEVPSIPVGSAMRLKMEGLDFEEFLWAIGLQDSSINLLKEYFDQKKPVPESIHTKMLEYFRQYIVIGGMPRAVQTFADTKDFLAVHDIQTQIVADYLDDIAKYAEGSDKARARACFLSIPRQLAKERKKFQYSVVEHRGTSAKFSGSLQWLLDAGIVSECHNLSSPQLPLEGYAKEDEFKVYMRDTGLLVSMLEDGAAKDILQGNLGIYKGAIYENVIADIFVKEGKQLYYFSAKTLEIDFIIRYCSKAAAVEVKSAENTKAKSLDSVMKNWGVQRGIKLTGKNIGVFGQVEQYPLYMAMFL